MPGIVKYQTQAYRDEARSGENNWNARRTYANPRRHYSIILNLLFNLLSPHLDKTDSRIYFLFVLRTLKFELVLNQIPCWSQKIPNYLCRGVRIFREICRRFCTCQNKVNQIKKNKIITIPKYRFVAPLYPSVLQSLIQICIYIFIYLYLYISAKKEKTYISSRNSIIKKDINK